MKLEYPKFPSSVTRFGFKLVSVVSFALLVSCTQAQEPVAPPAQATETTQAPANSSGTGSIVGTITYTKAPSPPKTVSMSADPMCAKAYKPGEKVTVQEIKTGPAKGLENVFVYIKQGAPKGPVGGPVTLDQKGCTYHPHIIGLQVGQTLKILNSDATLHNVHSLPKSNASFNLGMSTVGQTIEKSFTKPEIGIRVKCDVHGWMNAYIHVVDNPYFAVTALDGKFKFSGLGAGDYVVEAWHEKLGTLEGKAHLDDKGEAKVDLQW